MASLVEMEHEKIQRRKNFKKKVAGANIVESSEEDENENHSCEDEELVISPQLSSAKKVPTNQNEYELVPVGPIETFAE